MALCIARREGAPVVGPDPRTDGIEVPPSTKRPVPIFSSQVGPLSAPRLLLLSVHFPPARAVGARRWEKLAPFATARGYGLDVVALDPRDLDAADPGRLEALPPGVRVFGVRARSHPASRFVNRLARAAKRLRGFMGALRARGAVGRPTSPPDTGALEGGDWPTREAVLASKLGPASLKRALNALLEIADDGAWANAAAARAAEIADPAVHRAIISCGPPHMIHHAARRLSERTGIPLVLDFRDPWSRRERVHASFASPLWFRLAERYESHAVARSRLVVLNTPPAARLMAQAYPEAAQKILSVTNGFDLDEPIAARHDATFVIAYTGSIYLDRSPRLLFRATRRVADALAVVPSDLRIELMGYYDEAALRAMAEEEGVADRLVLHPAGDRRAVAQLLGRTAVAVNLPQDSDLAVPSKIFEYLMCPAWLLALAIEESATGEILAGTQADVVAPDDVDGIERVLRARYLAYRAGERPRPLSDDPRLGRAHQAGLLFDALERALRLR